ncbi:MAG: NBR1-Ig-like domain-containing protein [Anaerolineales bacterium]
MVSASSPSSRPSPSVTLTPIPTHTELAISATPRPQVSSTSQTASVIPEVTATPTAPSPTATQELPCYRATFIQDVTYRDGTGVAPGEIFLKIWRFRNDGSCEWNQEFVLDFMGGERFSGPDEVRVKYFEGEADLELRLGDQDWNSARMYRVRPGEIADVAVILRSPLEEGRHQGLWRVLAEDGISEVMQFYVDVEVVFNLEEEQELWSGEWDHENQWTDSSDNPLVFHQEGRQVDGYFYNSDGEVFVIDASLSADETRMEGSFGQIWQTGWPFLLELYENKNVFNGYYNDSDFTGGAWCGSRAGYRVPFGECLLADE